MAFEEEFDSSDEDHQPPVQAAEPAFEEEFDSSDDEAQPIAAVAVTVKGPPPLPAACKAPPPLPAAACAPKVPPPLPAAAPGNAFATYEVVHQFLERQLKKPAEEAPVEEAPAEEAPAIKFSNDGSFMAQILQQQQQQAGAAPENQIPDDGSFMAQFMKQQAAAADGEAAAPDVVGEILHTLQVSAEDAGARLAKFTSERFAVLSWGRNRAAASVRDGRVRVNLERSGANRVLEAGDSVTVHALPPCTMSTAEIERLLIERSDAKALKDYERADAAYTELQAAGVRVHDKEGKWSTNEGRTGQMPAATVMPKKAVGDLESGKKTKEQAEADRRRLKNKKKREAKEKKEALATEAAGGVGADEEPASKRAKE